MAQPTTWQDKAPGAGTGNLPLRLSVGVMAHNEEQNLDRLLAVLCSEGSSEVIIEEVLVVSSGSTDGTDAIAAGWQARDPRVRLIAQPRREGKSAAVNHFLSEARCPTVVLVSGDVLPEPGALVALVRPLREEPRAGMCGAHPVPRPRPGFLAAMVQLMWTLHHRVAQKKPKMGEMVALHRLFASIPEESAVDEATLEALVQRAGFALVYVPRAVVQIDGPSTVRELMRQRRRINAGHLWLARTLDYRVSTLSIPTLVWELLPLLPRLRGGVHVAAMAAVLESICRIGGYVDIYLLNRNPTIWARGARPGGKRSGVTRSSGAPPACRR